jgi:DNA-binding PadR family transcriptional regulator
MFPVFSFIKVLDSLILLHIVKEGPLHGYALVSTIEENTGWKPSQTAVYNALKSMEEDGLVSSEERIEKGRVQKIYSITEQGQQVFNESKELMKKHLMKNLSQFYSFAQMVGNVESRDESKALQQRIQSVFENMKRLSNLTIKLLREDPKRTLEFTEKTLDSLKKVAEEYGIKSTEGDEIN